MTSDLNSKEFWFDLNKRQKIKTTTNPILFTKDSVVAEKSALTKRKEILAFESMSTKTKPSCPNLQDT